MQVLKYSLDTYINTFGLLPLETLNPEVKAEIGANDTLVNTNTRFTRNEPMKVAPMSQETGTGLLSELDKLTEPLVNMNGIAPENEGNLFIKKATDVVRQIGSRMALTLASGESVSYTGTNIQMTTTKYTATTKPTRNISAKSTTRVNQNVRNKTSTSTDPKVAATQEAERNKTMNTNVRNGTGEVSVAPHKNLTGILGTDQAVVSMIITMPKPNFIPSNTSTTTTATSATSAKQTTTATTASSDKNSTAPKNTKGFRENKNLDEIMTKNGNFTTQTLKVNKTSSKSSSSTINLEIK
jgi:hypothetical protein